MNAGSSPKRATIHPPKTLITSDAAVMPTSKLRTNTGRVGATSPYPMAMRKAAPTSTQISRGIRSRAPTAAPAASTSTTRAPSPHCPPEPTRLSGV